MKDTNQMNERAIPNEAADLFRVTQMLSLAPGFSRVIEAGADRKTVSTVSRLAAHNQP
jgi:hypothetical protein